MNDIHNNENISQEEEFVSPGQEKVNGKATPEQSGPSTGEPREQPGEPTEEAVEIEETEEIEIIEAGEFTVPKKEEEEEEITEEELIRRIIEYKKFKEMSKVFRENYVIFSNRFYKGQEEIKLPKQKLEKDYGPEKIPDMYKSLVERNSVKINQNAKNIEKIALVDKYTVADKVKEMYKILTKQKKFVFNKLFSIKKREKQEVVTAFSGLLELSRRSKVETSQEEIFGDITVEEKKKREDAS